MPSIRIKDHAVYSNLENTISINDVRGEMSNSPNTYSHTSNIQTRPSLPLLPRELLDPSSHLRPRSATTSGRIHAHCVNTSRNSQFLQPPPNPLRTTRSTPNTNVEDATIPQRVTTTGGVQTDLGLPSPGMVESSPSLSWTVDDRDPRRSAFSDHHHDDVVEHLDVIGIFLPFHTSNLK
jgi:hypothetical protein